jgi:multimeric flavodoxin WrbA
MKALVFYCSITGNTEKVAKAIHLGLSDGGMQAEIKSIKEIQVQELDYFSYDLVCCGSPAYNWHVPKPMEDFLKSKHSDYNKKGMVKASSPRVEGTSALVFCTYSGPHTGMNEATPAGLYMEQFFDHLGISVLDKWYILSEFINNEEYSTLGRLGDIRGLRTNEDLEAIRKQASDLAQSLAESGQGA